MTKDCLIKRGKFIGVVNSLIQEFHYVEPQVMMKIINIYSTSFYGSNLWNLYSKEVCKIFSSWNVMVRNIFNVPRNTHRYLIETISESRHPKAMLCSRFVKFMESLLTSKKRSVRFLANLVKDDRRTLTGKTLSRIAQDCNMERDRLSYQGTREMKYWNPPEEESWRCPLLFDLLKLRDGKTVEPIIEQPNLDLMIMNICNS